MANEYESNERKNVPDLSSEPIEGRVILYKPSVWKKLSKVFFPQDVTSVKDYLIWDIFLPNLKDFLLKNVNDALSGSRKTPTTYFTKPKTTTGSWLDDNVSWGSGNDLPDSFTEPRRTTVLDDFDHLGYPDQASAKKVRNDLYLIAKSYGYATIADQCRCSKFVDPTTGKPVQIEPKWTYNDFGWNTTDIERADVVPYGEVWIITLPPARDVKKRKK